MKEEITEDTINSTSIEYSNWTCYMFGNKPNGSGISYIPGKGQVPNIFVRFMMKICFDCTWIKDRQK